MSRQRLARLLRQSPSLGGELSTFVAQVYTDARRLAAEETEKLLTTFPETCPWSLAQLQDLDFWPEAQENTLSRP